MYMACTLILLYVSIVKRNLANLANGFPWGLLWHFYGEVTSQISICNLAKMRGYDFNSTRLRVLRRQLRVRTHGLRPLACRILTINLAQ